MALTQNEINTTSALVESGNIAGFYDYIAERGDPYGRLGREVTDNSTWQGQMANNMAAAAAEDAGKDLTPGSDEWRAVNRELAEAYIGLYQQNDGQIPTADQVQRIHNNVYSQHGIDANGWLPNLLLNTPQSPGVTKQDIWNDYMSNDGKLDILDDATDVLNSLFNFSLDLFTYPEIFKERANFAKWFVDAFDAMPAAMQDQMLSSAFGTTLSAEIMKSRAYFDKGADFIDMVDPASYAKIVFSTFWKAEHTGSPLVLDLDGDGVELTALDSAGAVYWDIDQDGFGEASAWVGADDGLLAIDRNGDGLISDNNELFGTETTDGFSVLRSYDTNGDGEITAADAQFSSLLVWQDTNGDGYSDAAELHTLSDMGITSISLNATALTGIEIAGNPISHTSNFTMNGISHEVVDAWFQYDQLNSVYQSPVALDARAFFLPELRGYGELKNLSLAMSESEDLLELVEDLTALDLASVLHPDGEFDARVIAIMYEWAGITDVDTGSRGLSIGDARILEFVEAFVGEDYNQGGGSGANEGRDPRTSAAHAVRVTFSEAQRGIAARLLFQAGGDELFTGQPHYDSLNDDFTGVTGINFDNLDTLIDDLDLTGAALQTSFMNILNMINQVIGLDNLSSGDAATLESVVETALGNAIDFEDLKLFATNSIYGYALDEAYEIGLSGTTGDDVITGYQYRDWVYAGEGNDVVYGNAGRDTIEGEGGNDELYGGADDDYLLGGIGDDLLSGGSGDNYLVGGAGDDTYVYTSGLDILNDVSGTDGIVMPVGYELADMVLTYGGEYSQDLYIYFNDVLTMIIEFFAASPDTQIETITFADSTVFDFATEIGTTVDGTSGNDTLVGLDRLYLLDDIIQASEGDDTLTGGLGDDRLYGGSGSDIYYVGQGVDTIYEYGTNDNGGDTVAFGAGINMSDIRLETDAEARDLLIYVDDVLKVRVADQFAVYDAVEYISLNGGATVIDVMTSAPVHVGTSGQDYLTGIAMGASTSNIINALGGNDVVMAGDGDDTINGGAGDDTLNGGLDNDTYVYDVNYNAGFDTIIDLGGTDDKISVNTSLANANLSLSRNEINNLVVHLNGKQAMLLAGFFQDQGGIESIVFTDQTVSLTGIGNVVGTTGNDTLTGDASSLLLADMILADEGDDTISSGLGNDVVYAGAGDDLISAGDGADTLYGEDGADTLDGGAGDDILYGGAGADIYVFSAGQDVIIEPQDVADADDKLQFGAGITLNDITFIRDVTVDVGANLAVQVGTDQTTILNQFSDFAFGQILLADNSVINFTDVTLQVVGGTGADTMSGHADMDEIFSGGAGNDSIYGAGGDDILDGGAGDDNLLGGDGDDTLISNGGADSLNGDEGADTYILGQGAYDLTGEAVVTIYDASAGNSLIFTDGITQDDVRFMTSGSYLTISNLSGHIFTQIYVSQAYNGIPLADTFGTITFADNSVIDLSEGLTQHGTSEGEQIIGLTSDDVIYGYGGNDSLYGYDGDDTLVAGGGSDGLIGGAGNDIYVFGAEFAAEGTDYITVTEYTSEGTDTISFVDGITAADVGIWVDSSGVVNFGHRDTANWILVSGGTATVDGVVLSDAIESVQIGATTWDLTTSFTQYDTDDSHTIYALASGGAIYGYGGDDYVIGGTGNDLVYGGNGIDQILTDAGNDLLSGGAGDDYLAGGAGHDVYVAGAGDIVTDAGTADNDLYLVGGMLTGSLSITDYGGGNDALYVTLLSGQSYDIIENGGQLQVVLTSGTDTATITIDFQYGMGEDYLIERIIFGSYAGDITAWNGSYTHVGGYVMTENGLTQPVTYTSAPETVTGSHSAAVSDVIYGMGGNDVISLYAGNDYAYGGDGDDYLYGGDGNDHLYGQNGGDTISGEAGDDVLYGGAGADYLWGNTGNDVLYGEADVDALRGMEGDDTLYGGDGNDNLRGDDVDYSASFVGAGNDTICGGLGNDNIHAGAGNDWINGEAGQDTLFGDAGADTFAFDATSNAMDYVSDFSTAAGDVIDISAIFDETYDVLNNLSSFVQLQALSAHTRVQVDRDGAGSTYTWENALQIQNTTGLNLTTLVGNGSLIVD